MIKEDKRLLSLRDVFTVAPSLPASMNSPRPWQGTLLAIIEGIGASVCFFTVIILLLIKASGDELFSATVKGLQNEAGIFLFGLDLFLLGASILLGLATLYTLRGRRWPIVFCLTFFGLRLFLFSLTFFLKWESGWIEPAITIIALYCSIVCIRHPFYQQIKQPQE